MLMGGNWVNPQAIWRKRKNEILILFNAIPLPFF
jgi:hypothetical protein